MKQNTIPLLVRRWLNPVAGTSGTYSYTTSRGDDKDKDDEGGSD